jgi:hypothetical protein
MYLKLLSDMYLKLFRDMYLKLLSDMYLKLLLCFGITDMYRKLLKAILLYFSDMYLKAPEGFSQRHVP